MLSNIDNKGFGINANTKTPVLFKLETFDGPLDLLLELIKDKKMDILTLNIVEISLQYLEFVNTNLSLLPIDDISEYLVIAAYLTELKSKMIIPFLNNEEIDVETELEIDRLRRQLFLYKQYKDIVNEFRTCQHQRVQFIAKPCDDFDEFIPDEIPDAPLPEHIDLDRLVRAWRKVLLESQNNQIDKTFTISVSNIDVDEIEKKLIEFISNNAIPQLDFKHFILAFNHKINDLEYICAIFFALLSLSKNGYIKITQDNETGLIYIIKNLDAVIDNVNADVIDAIEQQKELAQTYKKQLEDNEKFVRKLSESQINQEEIDDSDTSSEDTLDSISDDLENDLDKE